MEEELGHKLCVRSHAGIRLTEKGEAAKTKFEKIIIEMDNLQSILNDNEPTNKQLYKDIEEKISIYEENEKQIPVALGNAAELTEALAQLLTGDFVSEEQASKIKHNAFLTDRVKTDNQSVLNNIAAINIITTILIVFDSPDIENIVSPFPHLFIS